LKRARFYCKAIGRQLAELTGSEAHHLADVLRLRAGDRAELFDGAGTLAEAAVGEILKERVVLSVEKMHRHTRRQSGRIVIAAAMAKGPEGAMTEQEQQLLAQQRATPVRLTETVLRVETAAVAFAAILAAQRDAVAL